METSRLIALIASDLKIECFSQFLNRVILDICRLTGALTALLCLLGGFFLSLRRTFLTLRCQLGVADGWISIELLTTGSRRTIRVKGHRNATGDHRNDIDSLRNSGHHVQNGCLRLRRSFPNTGREVLGQVLTANLGPTLTREWTFLCGRTRKRWCGSVRQGASSLTNNFYLLGDSSSEVLAERNSRVVRCRYRTSQRGFYGTRKRSKRAARTGHRLRDRGGEVSNLIRSIFS